MRRITVTLGSGSYDICVGAGIFDRLVHELASARLGQPFLLVSQPAILKALGRRLPKGLPVSEIPDGEGAKTVTTVNRLINVMVRHRLTRQSTVIAFGGGVVGDVAAFAASIYMRGIPVVQVPTTLLAQVDSSIGGKSGVNHRRAKNLVGTFHQPSLVLSDPELLRSLPAREYASGLYEALKYGIIQDRRLFKKFESEIGLLLRRDLKAVERLVGSCAAIKARVVMNDEKESDLRRILNFGHTVGHGLEAAGKFERLKHGEAVGYGMIAAARISAALKRLSPADEAAIEDAIRAIGPLPSLHGVKMRNVLDAMQHDKKVRDGAIHFVLPTRIGKTEIAKDVPLNLVENVVRELIHESN